LGCVGGVVDEAYDYGRRGRWVGLGDRSCSW
jgi:hypothetical protein